MGNASATTSEILFDQPAKLIGPQSACPIEIATLYAGRDDGTSGAGDHEYRILRRRKRCAGHDGVGAGGGVHRKHQSVR